MNGYEILKSVMAFNKNNVGKGLATVGNIQGKVVKKSNEILEKYSIFPEEGRDVVSQWAAAVKNNMKLIQVVTEKNYAELENYLSVNK